MKAVKGIFLLLIFLGITAVGCRIDPPLYLREASQVIVKVLWKEEVYPETGKPDGITLYFFRDGVYCKQVTTAEVDSCSVSLEPGRYRLYLMSYSPEEYGGQAFLDLTDWDAARSQVSETRSSWYTRAEGERLIAEPEWMAAGTSDEFVVSEGTVRVPVTPECLVSRFRVTIYSDNANMLRSAGWATGRPAGAEITTP